MTAFTRFIAHSALAVGVGILVGDFTVANTARVSLLSTRDMRTLTGSSCSHMEAVTQSCQGQGCPQVGNICMPNGTICEKVFLTKYKKCVSCNYICALDCTETSTTMDCGQIYQGAQNTTDGSCSITACSTSGGPCGEPMTTTTVTSCSGTTP